MVMVNVEMSNAIYPLQHSFRTAPAVPGLRLFADFFFLIVFLHFPLESFAFPGGHDFAPPIRSLLSPSPFLHVASGCFSDGNLTPWLSPHFGTVIQTSLYRI